MIRIKLVHKDTLSCEPIVRRTGDGSLLLVSQCGDTYEPAPGNRVFFFHSYDNGETWTPPEKIYPEDKNAVYCTEVSIIGEKITAYLTIHNGQFLNWRSIMMVSTDNGHTWTNKGPCPFLETYTFVRGKIELKNGNILIPYQHYPVSEAENERLLEKYAGKYKPNGKLFHVGRTDVRIDYVDTGVLLSRDGGETFSKQSCPAFNIRGDTGLPWIWSEPTLAELSDGRIAMLIRVKNEVLWYSESTDGGLSFSEFRKTDIPNPSCKPKLINLPDGKIALIHNGNSAKRNPFSLWISDDDMKTWKYKYIISDFPLNFDYPDGFYENGSLYISIELQRRDILFIEIPMDSLPDAL